MAELTHDYLQADRKWLVSQQFQHDVYCIKAFA